VLDLAVDFAVGFWLRDEDEDEDEDTKRNSETYYLTKYAISEQVTNYKLCLYWKAGNYRLSFLDTAGVPYDLPFTSNGAEAEKPSGWIHLLFEFTNGKAKVKENDGNAVGNIDFSDANWSDDPTSELFIHHSMTSSASFSLFTATVWLNYRGPMNFRNNFLTTFPANLHRCAIG
jgi:hypothetical protein